MGSPKVVPIASFHLLFLLTATQALVFTIPSGRVKCITETLRAGILSSAHYKISIDSSPSTHHTLSAKVNDPKGESLHHAESVEKGEFGFVAVETGDYSACFWSPKFDLFGSISVEFEWRTGVVASRPWESVVKKEKIDVMEMELKKLEDSVHLIHEDMLFLREREEEMQRLNENTNSRFGLLSLLSLLICLGVAGMQLLHLKTFFQRQKIL